MMLELTSNGWTKHCLSRLRVGAAEAQDLKTRSSIKHTTSSMASSKQVWWNLVRKLRKKDRFIIRISSTPIWKIGFQWNNCRMLGGMVLIPGKKPLQLINRWSYSNTKLRMPAVTYRSRHWGKIIAKVLRIAKTITYSLRCRMCWGQMARNKKYNRELQVM